MRIAFGECVLDLDSRQLWRGPQEVHLVPKAFELLKVLVQDRPKAISKRELQDRLWPSTFVVEGNLSNLVSELRAAVGDSPRNPRFIRTVHGFGYAFAGEALEVLDSRTPGDTGVGWLVWHHSQFPLAAGPNVIGRDPSASVSLDLPSVSRRHARIVVSSEGATLEDLGSKNGTLLRGEPVTGISQLTDGDRVTLGSVTLTFRSRSLGSTQTQAGGGRPRRGR